MKTIVPKAREKLPESMCPIVFNQREKFLLD
jgi:hypothetical protein